MEEWTWTASNQEKTKANTSIRSRDNPWTRPCERMVAVEITMVFRPSLGIQPIKLTPNDSVPSPTLKSGPLSSPALASPGPWLPPESSSELVGVCDVLSCSLLESNELKQLWLFSIQLLPRLCDVGQLTLHASKCPEEQKSHCMLGYSMRQRESRVPDGQQARAESLHGDTHRLAEHSLHMWVM